MAFKLHEQLAKDCRVLGNFTISQLLLMNDRQYPWCILVPRVANIHEIYQLSAEEQVEVARESALLGEILMSLYNGDKLNIAALGNMVPQLHIHHIVRFRDDAAWPKPIWGLNPPIAYSEAELETAASSISKAILESGEPFTVAP